MPDLRFGPPALHEAADVAALINRCSQLLIGLPGVDPERLAHQWAVLGPALPEVALCARHPDGRIVGYLMLASPPPHQHNRIWGRVDPDYWGQGVGRAMLLEAERRTQLLVPAAPPEGQVGMYHRLNAADSQAVHLLESLGYTPIHPQWQMQLDLAQPPPDVDMPFGVVLRPVDPSKDFHPLHAAYFEAFANHWGVGYLPPDRWWAVMTGDPANFDPVLWTVAEHDGQIVGFALCDPALIHVPDMGLQPEAGFINAMGVVPTWRRRGVAQALLLETLRQFWARGKQRVCLGVMADNVGAVALYEKAGMTKTARFVVYRKILRPGLPPDSDPG